MSRALFISDLHLSSERPAASERFFRFLDEEAARAGALYVLGDLFEQWPGDDALTDPAGEPLAQEAVHGLRRLVDAGVPVHFMLGNRDFLASGGFLRASGAQFLQDPSVLHIGREPVAVLHGDTLCTDDTAYQDWRRQARSARFQREFLARPLAERLRLAGAMREQSRQVTAATPPEIMDVNAEAVRDAFRRLRVKRMIHGHTHRPARHELEVDGTRCERWVLPDWYGPGGYLALDDVGPRLVSF